MSQSWALAAVPAQSRSGISRGAWTGTGGGQIDTTKINFQEAKQFPHHSPQADRDLLLNYLQTGKLAEAVEQGRNSVALWPRDAELRHLLGLAYFKTRQMPLAISELREAEALDGSSPDIHFDFALVYLDQGQYAPAADELEKATKLKPSNALARVLLGRAYQNTNRTLQAIEQFKTRPIFFEWDPRFRSIGRVPFTMPYALSAICSVAHEDSSAPLCRS